MIHFFYVGLESSSSERDVRKLCESPRRKDASERHLTNRLELVTHISYDSIFAHFSHTLRPAHLAFECQNSKIISLTLTLKLWVIVVHRKLRARLWIEPSQPTTRHKLWIFKFNLFLRTETTFLFFFLWVKTARNAELRNENKPMKVREDHLRLVNGEDHINSQIRCAIFCVLVE